MNRLDTFAALLAATRFEDIPAATVAKAKLHILDTLGAALAGSRAPETALVSAVLRPDQGAAALWGSSRTADARTAAFINGVAAHALELDDSGGCDHSGAVVLPAVIAALSRVRGLVTGADLLTAVLVGYEAGRRVLEAAGGYEVHNGLGWHSTGTCGAFGAAAAVARLYGLDGGGMAAALAAACSFAGGTWAFIHNGSQAKKLHAGRAAEAGILAAGLAAAGFAGADAVFETGQWGSFFDTFCRGEVQADALTEDYGRNWRLNRCSIKPYATCRGTHSAIDAVNLLLARHAIAVDDIAAIEVAISGFQFGMCGGTVIASKPQAQMSLPYALAARLHFGKVFLSELERPAWSDPAIAGWLARTRVSIDPAMADDAEPAITLILRDGQRFSATVEVPLGSPGNPLSEAQVAAKYDDLAGLVLPAGERGRLRDAVLSLDTLADAKALPPLLSAEPHAA